MLDDRADIISAVSVHRVGKAMCVFVAYRLVVFDICIFSLLLLSTHFFITPPAVEGIT